MARPDSSRGLASTSTAPLSLARRPLRPLLLLLALLPRGAQSLKFELSADQRRCVSEQIPAKSLLTGDWELAEQENASSTVEISGPDGASLFLRREREGHFALTAAHAGLHEVCIHNNASAARAVTLNLKTALEVEDHQGIAKKEHVEAIEAELDRMKKMAVHVYECAPRRATPPPAQGRASPHAQKE